MNDFRSVFLRELEHNLWTSWSHFGRGPGCALHDSDDLLWFETPLPMLPYNGVLRFRVTHEPDATIDSIVEHYRQRGVQFMWLLHPSAQPADLADRLQARGLQEVELIPGMVRTLEDLEPVPPLPEGVEIRQVRDDADAAALSQFAAWRWQIDDRYRAEYAAIVAGFRFGQPGSGAHMWQAWRGGEPVAKAGMYMSPVSAGIYAVATRPEARRMGLARALTLIALHYARDHGRRVAVLHSSAMAESLYRSMGFDPMAEFRLFASTEFHV